VASVDGVDSAIRALRDRQSKLEENIGKAVFVISDRVKARAQHLMTDGSVSGAGHVPSNPGEPPNADTRQLDKGIVSKKTGPATAEVRSTEPYSAALEFGAPQNNLEERPFMRPALAAELDDAKKLIVRKDRIASK